MAEERDGASDQALSPKRGTPRRRARIAGCNCLTGDLSCNTAYSVRPRIGAFLPVPPFPKDRQNRDHVRLGHRRKARLEAPPTKEHALSDFRFVD